MTVSSAAPGTPYRLQDGEFLECPRDVDGRVLLRIGSLRIGAVGDDVILFDAQGAPIGDYVEIEARLREEAAARRDAETRLRDAKARIRELEARLQRAQRQS